MGWMKGHPGVRGGMGGEQGKGNEACGTCGGSMYVYKKGTFLYRENGWSMHSNNTRTDRADGPMASLTVATAHENKGPIFACCFVKQSK